MTDQPEYELPQDVADDLDEELSAEKPAADDVVVSEQPRMSLMQLCRAVQAGEYDVDDLEADGYPVERVLDMVEKGVGKR